MPSIANIHKRHAYGKDAHTYYPVLIVGAGESGLAMGCRLKEALGTDQFRIFERQSGIGGTWWINRYPGVACDVYVYLGRSTWTYRPYLTQLLLQSGCILLFFFCTEKELVDNTPFWSRNCSVSRGCL